MARLNSLTDRYNAGMKRDFARDQMPPGSLWNLVDYVPDVLGARLRKRGGYTHGSGDLSVVTASASHVVAGVVAPFADGASNIAFDEDGRAYSIGFTQGTPVDFGAATFTHRPLFYNDKVIVPNATGSSAPQKITRAAGVHTIAALAGSPPNFRYAVAYKDVLWGAGASGTPRRIHFANAGNPEVWDLTNKYLDATFPITGMAALSNAVFVYSLSRTMRVRGSIPPPDSDFIVDDPIFEVGCTDARSIANYRDKVIWANAQGIYISDGTAMEDLTAICGMKSWWLDVMAGRDGFQSRVYDLSLTRLAGGIFRDYYVYSIWNDSFGLVDAGMIDLKNYTWTRHKLAGSLAYGPNVYWPQAYPEELFFGLINIPRAGRVSGLFVPSNTQDANGEDVLPLIETPFWTPGEMQNTFHNVYLGYDLRDPGGVSPTLTISYIDSPEETSYTSLSPTLASTSQKERVSRPLNFSGRGLGFKVAQTGRSSDTRLYSLEIESYQREGHR